MINLIPPEGKKVVQREYSMRVGTIAAFVCAFSLLVSAAALIPTYVLLIEADKATAASEDKSVPEKVEHYTETVDALKASMMITSQLGKPVDTLQASKIISHLESALSPEIVLEGMHFSEDKNKAHVEVLGTARSREALRQFVETLKKDVFFVDVQVPVSDLARDTDLIFTATIIVRL